MARRPWMSSRRLPPAACGVAASGGAVVRPVSVVTTRHWNARRPGPHACRLDIYGQVPESPRGHAHVEAVGVAILGNNRPRSDDTTGADLDARKDRCSSTDPASVPNSDWLRHKARMGPSSLISDRVCRSQKEHSGRNAHVPAERDPIGAREPHTFLNPSAPTKSHVLRTIKDHTGRHVTTCSMFRPSNLSNRHRSGWSTRTDPPMRFTELRRRRSGQSHPMTFPTVIMKPFCLSWMPHQVGGHGHRETRHSEPSERSSINVASHPKSIKPCGVKTVGRSSKSARYDTCPDRIRSTRIAFSPEDGFGCGTW